MMVELARTGVVYVHLLACCVAVGLVFMSKLDLVKRLLTGDAAILDERQLAGLHKTLVRALFVLWLTGGGLVAIDVWAKGAEVLANPILQAKFAIVALLTLNGLLMRLTVLPVLQRAGALMRLTFGRRKLAIFTGTVSGVSWFSAALLGVARPLHWKFSLGQIMAAYPVLVLGGFVAMLALTAWSQYQATGGNRVFLKRPTH
jgi:hypothetical protein